MKVGFATFGMPPEYNRKINGVVADTDIEKRLESGPNELIRVHIHTAGELTGALRRLSTEGAECLLVVLSHWTRIALVINLVKNAGLPAALYARTSGGYNGVTALTAASAGLREIADTTFACSHARFKEGQEDDLLCWIAGAGAFSVMKKSRLMCWGGAYGANMPYTRSDPDFLEARLVSEVMSEQEVVLTDRAERILADEPQRTREFISWVELNGLKIKYCDTMCTQDSINRQVALYLAARDRLLELEEENIRGVSIKCHFELSTTNWGCTACMLPAFLPFGIGPNGSQRVVPVACEGDLNGLVSLLILHSVNPDVPPLFGDFVEYKNDYVLLRNCGSSSVYWAGGSGDPAVSFPRTAFLSNIHGKTGAAVHFETPAMDTVTACRLFRLRNEFHLVVLPGRVLAENDGSGYKDPWPHTRLKFGVDPDVLFQVYPCNHSSLTRGDFTSEIEWFGRLAGIPVHVLRTTGDAERLLSLI